MRAFLLPVLLAGLLSPVAAEPVFIERTATLQEPTFVPRLQTAPVHRGNVVLTSVLQPGGAPFDGTLFSVLRGEPGAFGRMQYEVMARSGPQAVAAFQLGPGRYRVEVRNGAVQTQTEIEVPTAGRVHEEIVLDAGRLELQGLLNGRGAAAPDTWFRVWRQDQDAYGRPTQVQVAGNGYADRAVFVVPAGRYLVEASCGNASVTHEVAVTAGATTHQPMVLDAARLELFGTLSAGGAPLPGTRFTVYRAAAQGGPNLDPVSEAEPTEEVAFVLPAGRYRIVARHGDAIRELQIELEPGTSQRQEVAFEAAELNLLTTLAGDGEPLLNAIFAVSAIGPVAGPARVDAEQGPAHKARFVLPAGEYRVTARLGESESSKRIRLAAGDRHTETLALDAARVSLSLLPQGGHRPFNYTWFSVYRLEERRGGTPTRRRVFNEGYFASTDLVLPPGRYVAFARHQTHSGELDFAVAPGDTRTLQIQARF